MQQIITGLQNCSLAVNQPYLDVQTHTALRRKIGGTGNYIQFTCNN